MRSSVVLTGIIALLAAAPSFSLERYGRVKLSWSTMKVQFYGLAPRKNESFSSQENYAIREGVAYLAKVLPSIRMSVLDGRHLGSKNAQKRMINRISRNIRHKDVEVYRSGRMKVNLECHLTQLLMPMALDLAEDNPAETATTQRYSGLLIRLNRPMDPAILFELRDPSGTYRHSFRNVSKQAFERYFMGRFYLKASGTPWRYHLGNSVLELPGSLE
ncbi:MAG: hypothetical protein HRU19_07585 [Pseudobacteriovorax sp.]|nr:hypothetical protein [Pseudobacteriovorax sp.]